MSLGWILLLIVVLLALFGLYLSITAGRLDQLNRRVETSRHSLDTQLLRRLSLSSDLAGSGLLDPVSSLLLADAARAVRTAPTADASARDLAESDLSEVLRAIFATPEDVAQLRALPGGAQLANEMDAVTRRVEMARRFLNDGVRANRDVRNQRFVRWFRLAGTSVEPPTVELDDALPPGFGSR